MRQRVLDALTQYMSAAHAEMALRRAVSKARTDPRLKQPSAYPQVAAALEASVRLFASGADATAAVAQLRAVLTPDTPSAVTLELRSEADVSVARQAARSLAERMGARSFAAQHFTTAVSELARNIVQYAGTGVLELSPVVDEKRGLRLCAVDEGPGIADLDAILEGRYESATGMGKGITGARQLMHHFEITSSASGTRVEAELYL